MTIVRDGARRVAVRWDEPSAVVTIRRWTHRELAGVAGPAREARAVVEVLRALGGMRMRALLGATFVPDPASTVTVIEVPEGEPLGRDSPATCVSELGTPLMPGLPSDFAGAVADGLAAAARATPLPPGTLRVDRAGHDEVDSAEMAFTLAAGLLHTVLTALTNDHDHLTAAATTADAW
ncbi:MAG: hypothetical protein WBA97_28010 [Actinophytocola sp.]|uniref:hypothetical protein n=1 Tax=Actinophytocola sp. TaxID=1872138 RepID=UPI003C779DB9